MRFRRSLRYRVAITLALFAGAVSLTLATIIYLSFQDLERRLIDDTLTAELDDYVERRARNPKSLPERTATIRAFVVAASGGTTPIPAAVAALQPGRHRLELDGIPYFAAVRRVGAQRFVVLYDISASQRREQGFLLLLAGSVLLIMLISAFAGRWLAVRTIAPVTELARRVADLRPEDPPPHLADQFPWEEVQRLAADFDSYLARLHDFIERERLFTGDVSHELRTPLAIIKGATELLLADPHMDQKNQYRVARIGRAVAEMGEISGALLALAREQESPDSQPRECDVEAVASELVARYGELFRAKPIEVGLTAKARPRVKADRAVLAMVLGNLLRNALSFTDAGGVEVILESEGVRVEDTGQGIPVNDSDQLFRPYVRSSDSAGAGLGLSLVQRLCERQGWQVSLANRAEGGTVARLQFSSTAQPAVAGTTNIPI
jgi:signal transduction histidine kinase